jgi:hypothetical protein
MERENLNDISKRGETVPVLDIIDGILVGFSPGVDDSPSAK